MDLCFQDGAISDFWKEFEDLLGGCRKRGNGKGGQKAGGRVECHILYKKIVILGKVLGRLGDYKVA